MQVKSTDLMQHVNKVASMVVLLEPDDIQSLGEVLQHVEKITEEEVQDYASQVRNIIERLILDEYESPDVGLDELNSAVEQLQIACESMGEISNKELEQKNEQINKSAKESKSDEQQAKILMDEDEENQDSAEKKKKASPKPKKSESKPEPEPEPEAVVDSPAESAIDLSELDDMEDGIEVYLQNRDDPSLITQTLKEDPELVQGFIEESQENIQMIENGLIDWESSPDDLSLIDAIFRPFHTIKGVAGFLNLSDINSFAHIYEDLLDDARKGGVQYNEVIAEVVFEGVDALRTMITSLSESRKKKEYVPHGVDLEYYAREIMRARQGEDTLDYELQEEPKSTEIQVTDTPEPTDTTENTTSEKSPKRAPKKSSVASSTAYMKMDSSVKVSVQKMDNLIDLVGELVVTQNMVVQNEEIKRSSDKRLQQDIGQLKRITSSLQDLSMSLRMVPVKDIFQKMHRIVRDLSRKSGKEIALEMHGESTEIDRNMVDELYEPLVHMIRNNCDHGIEFVEDRRKAGKPDTGTIMLNAYYKGGMVVIEVSDDGKGIDVNKIKKRAIERGLCSENDNLSESQVLNFIFASGFSTSEKVTDVSGRGVGMDVVKKAIDRLRGSVEIKTKPGKGTSFSLRLPLTLAIIDGVIVQISDQRFIIPTVAIKESLIPDMATYNKIAGRGETVLIRDRVLPLVRIDKIFGIEGGIENPADGLLIIVESDGREAALLVDELIDKQEIVIKSLGDSLNKINGLAGGAIMSDGNVGLIIDVPTLLPKSKMTFKSD